MLGLKKQICLVLALEPGNSLMGTSIPQVLKTQLPAAWEAVGARGVARGPGSEGFPEQQLPSPSGEGPALEPRPEVPASLA